jgi:16S rRNA pseudouridine516 synthase
MKPERIDKIISNQGKLSRKEIKELIKKKQIKVNGKLVVKPEEKYVADLCEISISGKRINVKKKIYLMMNKPEGVVSATQDKKVQTVIDLVPEEYFRKDLFPAGRLDRYTVGFMLITNDGDFAHNILSPKKHISKTYIATVDGRITKDVEEGFRKGLQIDEGDVCKPAEIEVLENGDRKSVAKVIIKEGMYHQIKRMFLEFGLEVIALKRIKMGGLELDESLDSGECRELTAKELEKIIKG